MNKGLCLAISILLFISPATTLGFVDDVGTRETLRGIEGFQVVIRGNPASVDSNELQITHLQNVIENKLLIAGIKVLNTNECIKAPGSPWLYFTLDLAVGEPTYFKINVFVCQKAYLARNRANAYVVTWSTGYTGWVPNVRDISPHVRDAVDGFIESWQSVNLKYLLE